MENALKESSPMFSRHRGKWIAWHFKIKERKIKSCNIRIVFKHARREEKKLFRAEMKRWNNRPTEFTLRFLNYGHEKLNCIIEEVICSVSQDEDSPTKQSFRFTEKPTHDSVNFHVRLCSTVPIISSNSSEKSLSVLIVLSSARSPVFVYSMFKTFPFFRKSITLIPFFTYRVFYSAETGS